MSPASKKGYLQDSNSAHRLLPPACRISLRFRRRPFVREGVPLKVLGKEVTVIAIEQSNGVQGYFPEKSEGFHVEVVNQLKVPTAIHWPGLLLPNLMDGVPFVTQNPIAPGESVRGCRGRAGFREIWGRTAPSNRIPDRLIDFRPAVYSAIFTVSNVNDS